MYCMSEHEKFEQVGLLAEEYSKLKGELNHVDEKMARTQRAYPRHLRMTFRQTEFCELIKRALASRGLSRQYLGLELTKAFF